MTEKRHVQVRPLAPESPRSSAMNWVPPEPTMSERGALDHLKKHWRRNTTDEPDHNGTKNREILILDLDDYEFYGSLDSKRENEFCSLHIHSPEVAQVSLNGFVSSGGLRIYIQAAPLFSYSIEGYDYAEDGTITIFVQSKQASKDDAYDIWYRLTNKPTTGYRRFYDTFVWIATFGKHFVDYLGAHPNTRIGLLNFRDNFHTWLKARYKNGPIFRDWHNQFGRNDFRRQVNAHITYLYNQAYNMTDNEILLGHDVWAECMIGDRLSIERQPLNCETTITTPFVHGCFKNMYFGYCLEQMAPNKSVRKEMETRKHLLGFPLDLSLEFRANTPRPQVSTTFKVGDVVGVPPDPSGPRDTSHTWLAYVQKVVPIEHAVQRLYVLWLYHPSETLFKGTAYPISKEYFLSDNCNDGPTDAPLLSTEIVRIYSVDWSPRNLNTNKDILVRQKYITHEKAFVTLKPSDLTCECGKTPTINLYHPGDTVYLGIKLRNSWILEPVVIAEVNAEDMVTIRRLRRLGRDCHNILGDSRSHAISKNELVWTDDFEQVNIKRLNRKCHIRFYPKEDVLLDQIPVPYNRRGICDFWYFSRKLIKVDGKDLRLEFLDKAPKALSQGLDPGAEPPFEKLIGLSIFSGSGNFDRGLEEGGAIEFRTAIDLSPEAIHTQKANARHPETLNLYCGSVDDYLKAVLTGECLQLIARIGEVLFISGGSPCPGFSALQLDPFGERSCRNASHITTICSYVDIYRPQYAIFENVVNMSATRKGYENQNVLSHVVACFVAMGYQVQFAIIDAWSFSSGQSRERLCIWIAAPGLEPISHPWHTHCHPETTRGRSLGKQYDGVSFGDREQHHTPFDFTTAGEVVAHLPDIGTGSVQACIPFPDHRLATPLSMKDRIIARYIPIQPPGQGYAEAMTRNLIPHAAKKNMSEVGRSFSRIRKDGLFPTITTTLSPQNSRANGVLHWEQPRPITIEEAREAQGFLENEVIIGRPAQQLVQIGNAVDRNPALDFGFRTRDALVKSISRGQYAAQSSSKDSLSIERKHAVGVQVPLSRQEIPQPESKVSNGTSIKPVQQSVAQTIFRIFGKGRVEEPKPFLPPSSNSTPQLSVPSSSRPKPQPKPSKRRKDFISFNGRSFSRNGEVEPAHPPSSEATPQPISAKRQRDYIFIKGHPLSADNTSISRKKTRHSEQRSEFRSTVTRQKEATNSNIHSVYSETIEVEIRTQHIVSMRETFNDRSSHLEKQNSDTNSNKCSLRTDTRDILDGDETLDLTKDEDEPKLKKTLSSTAQKHQTNSESSLQLISSTESRKRTRHSGHQVEFTPTHWNRKPESMLGKRAD